MITAKVEAPVNYFTELYRVNVAEHVEKKNGFSYVSWPFAVAELRKRHPTATWEVVRFEGLPYQLTPLGFFVEVAVTVNDIRLSQIHPVLDHANRPLKDPTAFHINTSIQRCLVKAIALHGLGLFVYAGEDLPERSDAKGELGKVDLGKGAFGTQVTELAQEFRLALGLNISEEDKATAVYAVHARVVSDPDLYAAIGDCLTPRESSALHTYVGQYNAAKKKELMAANGRAR